MAGPEAAGKEAEKEKWPYLINNGRTNISWQSLYLDQDNEFVTDREPYPIIQMNPQDMADIAVKAGDLVEIYNDNGSTQAMVYPTASARRKQTFMQFANASGVQGNVVSSGVNEFVIPNYNRRLSSLWRNAACLFMCHARFALAGAVAVVNAFARGVESLPRDTGRIVNP